MISNDNRHDVGMVYQVQMEVTNEVKKQLPYITSATHFSVQGSTRTVKTSLICAIISV